MHIVFPWQQWYREHASLLCYTYIAYLVISFPLIGVSSAANIFTFHLHERGHDNPP